MISRIGLAFIYSLWSTVCVASSQNDTKPVSSELFNSLEELSRLVDIAYCVSTTGVQEPFQCLSHCAEFPEMELIDTWNTGIFLSDSCGYIAVSHTPGAERIIVAFRGTYSITNTIIDLSAYPQAYVPYTGEDGSKPCENCTVHAGFMTSWVNTRAAILPYLLSLREQYPDYEVSLVGHSLGGAVAALAGLEMRLAGWDPLVTTFGEPMIGSEEFMKFLDEAFLLESSSSSNLDMDLQTLRFRRVTHVNDPVPLLPLREWGYAPHAGEIFIAKSDLSPSREDVRVCIGDEDPRCIAGAETTTSLLDMYRDVNIPANIFSPWKDPCPSYTDQMRPESGPQVVIGEQRRRGRGGPANCASKDAQTPLYPLNWDWSLIPARYRLWELFHSHRDYFWRIGLCVPGGDPSGWL
ncbi:hypothetical protein N7478_013391 [Penicillium angulare]|uniref:uncharacterized protein n=1 Tax=Penicillium angulare TaxID=116970 RepID=UPI0025401A1D|nr:uncharacterized protein N7478_013391 [Penicillium angulare]KAJ5257287.1 hypothetical protein N7478_013391 [Penicillium angulare]